LSALAQSLLSWLRLERRPNVLAQEIMTKNPLTVPLETAVSDARRMMAERRIRHLLITDGHRLVGIVTDRDIRLNMPSPATSLSVWEINYLVARLSVDSIMTAPVITVDPRRNVVGVARIMLDHKIGALPVVDEGMIVGIVTETDVLRAFAAMAESEVAAT
jgi:acetoin utilization protein AcuB